MSGRLPLLVAVALATGALFARNLGFGIDAFNRVVPASAGTAAAFSPASFEIDAVTFAEAVDPIRRAIFAVALGVTDEFEAEYRPLARAPFELSVTNQFRLIWAHAIAVYEPRMVDPTFRLGVQELYGVEVCRAKFPLGVEAWVKTGFVDAFDDWRLPPVQQREGYSLHDLVSVEAIAAPSNGVRRTLPTHTLYRVPLLDGKQLYAFVPKPGRSVSSLRARLTSVTLSDILATDAAVIDPPVPVRVALPPMDIVSTNELMGAFQYFRFPTGGLRPFSPSSQPELLRQIVRLRLTPAAADPAAEPLEGPFLFFIYDPDLNSVPIAGIYPGKGL